MIQLALVIIAIIAAYYVAQNLLDSVREVPSSYETIDFFNITTTNDPNMNWE